MSQLLDVDPYAGDVLAQRLDTLDIRLPAVVADAAEWGSDGRPRPAARGRRLRLGWRVAVAGSVAVTGSLVAVGVLHIGGASTVTVQVPGFTVEVAASDRTAPRMSREQATAVALAFLSKHPVTMRGSAQLTGFVVAGATYESDVLKVWENCGAHWYLQTPSNLWVIDLSAPPQLGSTYVRGSVLVDDDTAQVKYVDFLTGKITPAGC
jgi:hypothetical protein